MSSHPFITTKVQTIANDVTTTSKINTIYMVGVATTGNIGDNKIAQIKTLADFNTLVGSNAGSRPDYEFIRKIDQSVTVYFVNGKSANATPTLSDHLIAGFLLLSQNVRLPAGIVICPETSGLSSTLAGLVFTAAESFVNNSLINWQYFHNTLLATQDATAAIAERNSFVSSQGHSSLFFGYGRDDNNNQIGLATASVAKMTVLNRRTGYLSPSAYQEPIPFKSVDVVYLPKWSVAVDEYKNLNEKNINTIFLDGDGLNSGVYTICGARTLSTDLAWLHINTRYAANNVFSRCAAILKPFLFLPADINAVPTSVTAIADTLSNADIILALRVLLDDMQSEGAFATPPLVDGKVVGEPYEIRPNKAANGDLYIDIVVTLVQTRERIMLNFIKRG